jgi:hypothetical protein
MTQAEHVLIRGKCFLYRQKAPFVPSGISIHGALEYEEATDRVRCHECGGWFRMLTTHLPKVHNLTAAEYRQKHGLRRRSVLCGPRLCADMRSGKEESYERLRERTRTPEWRAKFGAMARANAGKQPAGARMQLAREEMPERLNETGHCRAQLTQRLRELHAQYGGVPTNAQLAEDGIHLPSVLLAFSLPTISEVLELLNLNRVLGRGQGGGYTREELIEVLRDFWAKYGRLPGRVHERMGMVPRWDAFNRKFGSIVAAYEEAGLPQKPRSPHTREGLIELVRAFYKEHGYSPRPSRQYGNGHGDSLPPGFPSSHVFRRVFGSMLATYEAAGVPPPMGLRPLARRRAA